MEEYAKRLTKRYAPIEQRHGMISHFHKDHVNGFSAILQEEPLFFQRMQMTMTITMMMTVGKIRR